MSKAAGTCVARAIRVLWDVGQDRKMATTSKSSLHKILIYMNKLMITKFGMAPCNQVSITIHLSDGIDAAAPARGDADIASVPSSHGRRRSKRTMGKGAKRRSAQINVTEPSRRIRRPHPPGDLRAALAFNHRYIELAL